MPTIGPLCCATRFGLLRKISARDAYVNREMQITVVEAQNFDTFGCVRDAGYCGNNSWYSVVY